MGNREMSTITRRYRNFFSSEFNLFRSVFSVRVHCYRSVRYQEVTVHIAYVHFRPGDSRAPAVRNASAIERRPRQQRSRRTRPRARLKSGKPIPSRARKTERHRRLPPAEGMGVRRKNSAAFAQPRRRTVRSDPTRWRANSFATVEARRRVFLIDVNE